MGRAAGPKSGPGATARVDLLGGAAAGGRDGGEEALKSRSAQHDID